MVGCCTARGAGLDLYQAQTAVTGQGEANRLKGFAQCLEDVLVRVSGDQRLLGDPAIAKMADKAGSFVKEFRYHDQMSGIPIHDEQGTRDRPYDLIVSFQAPKIDEALRSLGREPWTAPRPRVAVFLGVCNQATIYILASDGVRGPGQREALHTAAERRGVPMVIPSEAVLAKAGLTFDVLSADLSSLEMAASVAGGDLALAGRMTWKEEGLAWISEWRFAPGGKIYHWQFHAASFDDVFRGTMGTVAQILSGNGPPD